MLHFKCLLLAKIQIKLSSEARDTGGALESQQTLTSVDCGRKLENLEKTHCRLKAVADE